MKYMIGKEEAKRIINEVKEGVSKWKPLTIRLGIAKRERWKYLRDIWDHYMEPENDCHAKNTPNR